MSVTKPTTDTPPKPKPKEKSVPSEPTTPIKPVVTDPPATADEGRSSSNGMPTRPRQHSTPKDQHDTHKNDESVQDLFDDEPITPEPSKIRDPPQKPSADSGTFHSNTDLTHYPFIF